MSKLVSIVIPCYNSEKWLQEAIDSCLNQSYPKIEIIVIDDGSSDNSLEIIKSYGNKVIWETGENRGGNHARNRGVAISKGDYIQFLDADDYILPTKVARQVEFLETTDADIVYGDWRHQRHFPDGKFILEEVQISGQQPDVLASLLADWWISPACLLFTRKAVTNSNGWDESLKAGQDRDFFLHLVIQGYSVAYQPGCHAIYRRHGNTSVSTASATRYLESQYQILQKAEQHLTQMDKLSTKYRCAMAQSYFYLARGYLNIDKNQYDRLLKKTLTLCPHFEPEFKQRTKLYNFAQKLIGFQKSEKIVSSIKLLKKRLLLI